MTYKPSQIVFFLGAGASVKAGVPDTFSFVREFVDSLTNEREKQTVTKIIDILTEWRKEEIDIELLLETLTKLQNKEAEPLLLFYANKTFILESELKKQPIIKKLKDFIKSKAIVSEDKIAYFKPMLGFIEEYRPLDIISLNYDTCIEQLARVNRWVCHDGFDDTWKPETFEDLASDLRLYKLHGSILWYETDNADYIKIKTLSKDSEIQLATGEKAQNLMLYPMQKMGYSAPLLDILVRTKRLLESKECELLVVVGYSFRDEHITKIVLDSAQKNRNLHVILIGPNAYDVYYNKLKFYKQGQAIPSSLDGKVCCLPYKFEAVFPELKDQRIKKLQRAIAAEKELQRSHRKGELVDWMDILTMYADIEHFEKVAELLPKVKRRTLEERWSDTLWIYLTTYINLLAGNNACNVEYLAKFSKLIEDILITNLVVWLNEEPYSGDKVCFRTSLGLQNQPGTSVDFEELVSTIEGLENRFRHYVTYGNQNFRQRIDSLCGNLTKLREQAASYGRGVINLESYIAQKRSDITTEHKNLDKQYNEGYRRNLLPIIELIEKNQAKKVIDSIRYG